MAESVEPGERRVEPGDGPAAGANALPRAYAAREVEREIYERWLAADVFAPDGAGSRADQSRPPFVIIQPPPNVTGALHLGHAARVATEDLMVRRARMQGRPTLWLPGLDHASIAAQFVLDGIIAAEGETRTSLGRERYLERMWRFVGETRDVMTGQQRRLGASADWTRARFTMDEVSARAVRTSFKRLYEDGLAYRSEALINWCPTCCTSLSDLEVISTPEKGTLWFVRYHLLDEEGLPSADETITVATTRPETILGDTAVAVHPDDARYRALVGRRVLVPLVDRPVPIIADPVVQREFGTGAVKITPAHDHDDHQTGLRHRLPSINVMDDEARITQAGAPFTGLPRDEARRRVVEALDRLGDLVEARPHELVLGRCQRSDDIVEPRLKVQWFLRTEPMAQRAMAAVREGRTRIVPARFEKVFFSWLENIRDWNVSRQLWWGHRIPAWYCPDGHITVSADEEGPATCQVCGRPRAELRQDEDIFDTWYSSGLWPFSTLGWPDDTPDLARYYPGSVMETGYDILFFWVARMMMLGGWIMGREPFQTVYLSGLIRDPYGRKMSKTRGNVIDPLGVIDEIGADALRFALIHGSGPGADQRRDASRLEAARNFANKLWNAARFVLGSRPAGLEDSASLALPSAADLGPPEHWILERCSGTTGAVDAAYARFQFGEATRLLYEAIWSEFCDWYLEFAKIRLAARDVSASGRAATWYVLSLVLDRYLRLLHPVMPHITEAIWGRLPHRPDDPELLMVADWPAPEREEAVVDRQLARGMEGLHEVIRGIRNARSEAKIEAGAWLDASVAFSDADTAAAYPLVEGAVARLARVRFSTVGDTESSGYEDQIRVVTSVAQVLLRRAGADPDRERGRLRKELTVVEAQLGGVLSRLGDSRFLERAPASVVDGARSRESELRERVERLRTALAE